MLKKTNRLAKTKDVQRTTMRGRSFFNPNFVIKYSASQSTAPRFTVTIATKVSKRAVVRNKIKRIIREAVRTNMARFRSGDYVIIVRPSMTAVPPKEIPQLILQAMMRNRLYS